MEVLHLTAHNCVGIMREKIEKQEECIIYGSSDGVYVLPALTCHFNKEFCEKNNIHILPIPNEGGALVIGDGDFEIAYFTKDKQTNFNKDFAKYFVDFLNEKDLNAKFVDNDILLFGQNKCAGCSSKAYGDLLYCAFHISINVNLELIRSVCTKPMEKVPKGLNEVGITTDDIEKLFLKFIKEKNYA